MNDKKLAVLIDADNTSPKFAEVLFQEIAKYGEASARRIYGDWSKNPNNWQDKLLEYALMPIQQFAYIKGKDATDMQLIIDAMDLLYSKIFDGFCLVSSDSDFTPLAQRLRQSGMAVYGFGTQKTHKSFINACVNFTYFENLDNKKLDVNENDGDDDQIKNMQQSINNEMQIEQVLRSAVKQCADESGWSNVSSIGQYVRKIKPDYDPRTFNFSQLSKHLKSFNDIQLRLGKKNVMCCRKIPFREIVKALTKEVMPKYQDKNGYVNISEIENQIKNIWDWESYGFKSFLELLEKIYAIEIIDNKKIKIKEIS